MRFLLLLLISTSVFALEKTTEDDVTACWTPPTEYTDGSSLPPVDLKSYTVYWTCDASGEGSKNVDAPQVCTNLKGNLVGQCSISVTATVTNNSTSERSTSVDVFVKLPKPSYGGFR